TVGPPSGQRQALLRRRRWRRKEQLMSDLLKPKDRPEAVALFRAQVIGPLLCRDFGSHGQLAEAIRAISAQPVRPPGHTTSRTYGASTIERWYYAFRKEGLGGLRPRGNERGFALGLDDELRELLRAIRKDHPQVSAALLGSARAQRVVAHGRVPRPGAADRWACGAAAHPRAARRPQPVRGGAAGLQHGAGERDARLDGEIGRASCRERG